MNIEQVRNHALSMRGATEDQPFGDDIITFRIEGKIFMCLWLGGGPHDMKDSQPRFAIKLDPERNIELREQYASITPAWHWNKRHWSDIYYENLDSGIVKSLIEEAYRLVVSKLPKAKRQEYM